MPDPKTAVLAAVTSFAQAATTRDVAALEACLAPSAVQHVRMGEAWSALSTPAYLQLMRDEKIGGEPVTLDVHDVTVLGAVATVHGTRLTPSLRFEDVLTLTDTGAAWQIVAAAVVVTPVVP